MDKVPNIDKDIEPNVCCCGHGSRCTCSLKKDHFLDTVPEDTSQSGHSPKDQAAKPRVPNHNTHESKPTIFSNGHHKPVHKFNDAHNHLGAPYRVPSRSHTVHGHREIAQRSTDSLPLTNRTVPHHESPLHNVTSVSQQVRQVRSEHNSPALSPVNNSTAPPFNVEIPPLSPNAYSYSPFDSQSPSIQPGQFLPDNIPDSWFTTFDEAQAFGPPGGADMGSVDWASYGLGANIEPTSNPGGFYGLGQNNFNSSQIPSYATSMEHLNQLNNQSGFNTSSGELSETEEGPSLFRPSNLRTISHASNDISSTGGDDASESHRLSSASSYFGTPQGNMLAGNLEDLDIDKYIAEHKQRNLMAQQSQSQTPELQQLQPQQQPTPPQSQRLSTPESVKAFPVQNAPTSIEHPYTIHEAQAYAHMGGKITPQVEKQQILMQNPSLTADPMWCDGQGDGVGFQLDDEQEDEQWVR